MNPPRTQPMRSNDSLRGIHRLGVRSARIAELAGVLNGLAHAHSDDHGFGWLRRWLHAHPEIHDQWPASDLLVLLDDAFAANPENPAECRQLYRYLRNIRSDVNRTLANWSATPSADFDPPQTIEFDGASFCFTGLFAGFESLPSPRAAIEQATVALGGTVQPAVTRSLRYLIVGSNAHPSWSRSSHGTKIARAHYLRRRYRSPILILRESDWARSALARPETS